MNSNLDLNEEVDYLRPCIWARERFRIQAKFKYKRCVPGHDLWPHCVAANLCDKKLFLLSMYLDFSRNTTQQNRTCTESKRWETWLVHAINFFLTKENGSLYSRRHFEATNEERQAAKRITIATNFGQKVVIWTYETYDLPYALMKGEWF